MKNPTFSNEAYCLFVAQETGRLLQKEFKCNECGECCHEKEIIVQGDEVEHISEGLGMTKEEFILKYLRKVGNNWSIRETNPCLFLDNKTKKCKIYEFRPFNCQVYPFLTEWFVFDLGILFYGKTPLPKNVVPSNCAFHEQKKKIKAAKKKIEMEIRTGKLKAPPECFE